MALRMDGFFDEHDLQRQRTADTVLLGATTHPGLQAYWPGVAEDPGRSPAVAQNPDVAALHREIGRRNNEPQGGGLRLAHRGRHGAVDRHHDGRTPTGLSRS